MKTIGCLFALCAALTFAGDHHSGGHHHEQAPLSFGQPGKADQVTRTVEIKMDDTLGFIPSTIEVKQGETIRFRVKNVGQLQHELVMGAMKDLKAHREMMRDMPDMKHDDPHMISLAPQQEGSIIWQFTQTGSLDFACLIADHMELGMVGKMVVKK